MPEFKINDPVCAIGAMEFRYMSQAEYTETTYIPGLRNVLYFSPNDILIVYGFANNGTGDVIVFNPKNGAMVTISPQYLKLRPPLSNNTMTAITIGRKVRICGSTDMYTVIDAFTTKAKAGNTFVTLLLENDNDKTVTPALSTDVEYVSPFDSELMAGPETMRSYSHPDAKCVNDEDELTLKEEFVSEGAVIGDEKKIYATCEEPRVAGTISNPVRSMPGTPPHGEIIHNNLSGQANSGGFSVK